MIRIQILLIFCIFGLTAQSVSPVYKLKADGAVTDILKDGNTLYASTNNASVNVFDLDNRKRTRIFRLESITDFMGESINPKIYDIDKLPKIEGIIAAVQGVHGFTNVYRITNQKIELIIKDVEQKWMIKKVKFIDENTILFGLLSNELILYNMLDNKVIYQIQVAPYTFSDIALNEARTEVITADESGIIHVFQVRTGKLLKQYSGKNVDKIYQLDYMSARIIGGGQDRRVCIYNRNTTQAYFKESDFLIYSVGLSPSGKTAAYSANEENDIVVFNAVNKQQIAILKGSETVINTILFISDNELISSSDDANIIYWKI